jgi:hypothetical protein
MEGSGSLYLAGGCNHHAGYSAKDFANVAGYVWYDRACSDRDKTSHQSVLDKVLSVILLPNPQAANYAQVPKL